MNKGIAVFAILITIFCACTEREIIIPPFEPIISDRVVLVEEVTGVRCPNCPSGSAKVQSLLEQFPSQVIAMNIHGSFLTAPYSDSKFDFRFEEARELENYLKPWEGKPAAFVNRKKFDEEPLTSISEFDLLSSYVAQVLNAPHQLEISMGTDFDVNTRAIEINLGIIPLADLSGEFRIHVVLTEDNIIDRQANVSEIIEAYEHNHVMRMMLTQFDGNPFSSQLIENELSNMTFKVTIPAEDGSWIADNMHVIAFISNHEDDGLEILQAVELPVISN